MGRVHSPALCPCLDLTILYFRDPVCLTIAVSLAGLKSGNTRDHASPTETGALYDEHCVSIGM